jgi:hypothetical protein
MLPEAIAVAIGEPDKETNLAILHRRKLQKSSPTAVTVG